MHRYAFLLLVTATALLHSFDLCADELVLKGGTRIAGTFDGFKNDRISFATLEGQKTQRPLMQVDSLTVDPAAKVSVKPRTGKKMADVKIAAYTNRTFFIEQNGRTVKLPSTTISMIEMELDFSRAMALQAEKETPPAPDEDVSIESLVKTGAVTIIHFHMPNVIASVRQGSYAQGLADQSHGRIKLAVITLDGFDSPAATKYQITSVPQFWFCNIRGKIVRKLEGQFEESEIDKGIRDAKR